ncbi:cytochrome c [Aliicoccus persicus]|uniref:Cytochrome c n=1 Tax=Aliicoccus persicus TaxID=930138 RepID=A0A662Z242_9STAP|nr:cytochrome c [Aliicoccus persicus]SEV82631.1 cytochrome c550 [Aliicoccus persicus]HJE19472.1 cytochrome c [Aliicoccus persicus]
MSNRRPLTDKEIALQGKKDEEKIFADGQGRPMVNMGSKGSFGNPVIWMMVIASVVILLPILIYHISPGGDLGGGENTAGAGGDSGTEEVAESDEEAVSGEFDAIAFARDNCASCHGQDLTGSMGPSILGLDVDTFETAVREGPGAMPEYSTDQISDEDLAFMAEYYSGQ